MNQIKFNKNLTKYLKNFLDEKTTQKCLEVVQDNPKPKYMLWDLYFTYVSIFLLEKIGNSYPSQLEIEEMELIFKKCVYKECS